MKKEDYVYTPRSLSLDTVLGPEAVGNEPKVRLAIVGAGSMGAEHIETAMSVGKAEVVGIYDPYRPSIDYALQFVDKPDVVKIYNSIREVGEDENVDAIIIASPNYLHLDNLRELLPFNKHILCEKPMTSTLKDALEVVELTRNYEKVFHVGFEYREKAIYKEAAYQAKIRKDIGDIKMIYMQEHRVPFIEKWNQWNKFSDKSGGTLVEKCCHYFDLFSLFAESEPVKVYASGAMDVNFRNFEFDGQFSDIIDNAFVIVDYENGIRACLNINMFSWKPEIHEYMAINGDKGSMYLRDAPYNEVYVGIRGETPTRRYKVELPENISKTGTHSGSTYYEHLNFINAIQGRLELSVSAEEGMRAIAIGAAAELSVKTGEPVYIKDLIASCR